MPRIVIVGFGNLGQAILPLLAKEYAAWQIVAFDKNHDLEQQSVAREMNIELRQLKLDQRNYQQALAPLLDDGDYLLNLAVEVSTIDLITLAQQRGAFYLDAGIEPWAYQTEQDEAMASNYQLREQVLAFARSQPAHQRSAVIAQGANPGFVSTLIKCALEKMARMYLPEFASAKISATDWPLLAERLAIRVIQISECDTQVSYSRPQAGEFVNTWSVDGLITEALQAAEAGWGSHEKELPEGALQHTEGCQAAIMFAQPGANMRVRSWSPNQLEFEAFLITHNESISIADFLSVKQDGKLRYRPTVYFAYRPCEDTVAAMALIDDGTATRVLQRRVIKNEVVSGIDELGVFLLSERYPALWLGSNLSVARSRALAPYNNATSLQVVSSIVGAMRWIAQHPNLGVIESEQLDHQAMYEFVAPYWGPMLFEQTTWRPDAAKTDWQFEQFVVKTDTPQEVNI